MKMRWFLSSVLSALLVGVLAPAAVADPPSVDSEELTFEAVNPCTDNVHIWTITATFLEHDHDGRLVVRAESTISTSDGYAGRETFSFVDNEQTLLFRFNNVLTNDAGSLIRRRALFVADPSGTFRVEVEELATCVRA